LTRKQPNEEDELYSFDDESAAESAHTSINDASNLQEEVQALDASNEYSHKAAKRQRLTNISDEGKASSLPSASNEATITTPSPSKRKFVFSTPNAWAVAANKAEKEGQSEREKKSKKCNRVLSFEDECEEVIDADDEDTDDDNDDDKDLDYEADTKRETPVRTRSQVHVTKPTPPIKTNGETIEGLFQMFDKSNEILILKVLKCMYVKMQSMEQAQQKVLATLQSLQEQVTVLANKK